MSFAIKCNKCGSEQNFKEGMNSDGKNISLFVKMVGDFSDAYIDKIVICCENGKCKKELELDY